MNCECHGEPTVSNGHGRRCCRVKRAASRRRYDQSPAGKARYQRDNAKRVIVGNMNRGGYFGRAATAEQAAEINAKGRALLADFRQTQKEARDAAGS